MFYTPCLSNTQSPHNKGIIPTSCTIPPESHGKQEDDAGKGSILFVYRGFKLLEGGFGISGYFRIFHPNVLHMFYTLTDVLHFNNLRICFRQE